MKPPETIYRGERLSGPRGEVLGVQIKVIDPDGRARLLSPQPATFEWGYRGAGPARLARAVLLDVTGDVEIAEQCHRWFMWGPPYGWGDRWEITAAQILGWVAAYQRETPAEEKGYERVVVISAEEGGAH